MNPSCVAYKTKNVVVDVGGGGGGDGGDGVVDKVIWHRNGAHWTTTAFNTHIFAATSTSIEWSMRKTLVSYVCSVAALSSRVD